MTQTSTTRFSEVASSPHAARKAIFAQAPGLEVSEALFRSIPNVLFCIKDKQRRYVAANHSFVAATLKSSLGETIGRTASELFPPLFASAYEQQDDEIFESGHGFEGHLEMITRADGRTGWFISQKVPVKDQQGKVIAVAVVSRDLEVRARSVQRFEGFQRAIDRLYKDYAKPLKIGDLAAHSEFSWSQFQRRFTQITGLSPRQLLTKIRLDAATQQLVDTKSSIGEIALACGFYDQAAFSRKFREVTGLSPAAYRKAMREVNKP